MQVNFWVNWPVSVKEPIGFFISCLTYMHQLVMPYKRTGRFWSTRPIASKHWHTRYRWEISNTVTTQHRSCTLLWKKQPAWCTRLCYVIESTRLWKMSLSSFTKLWLLNLTYLGAQSWAWSSHVLHSGNNLDMRLLAGGGFSIDLRFIWQLYFPDKVVQRTLLHNRDFD